jgi:hypothetical protein
LGEDCVLTFLQEQPANMAASAKGFKALFRRYAEHGRQGLTEEQFHLANREESIWEFRKGALRVFCFMDNEEHLTVLTHGTVKRSQKVKPAEVTAAVAAKNRYLTAKKVGQIDLVENDNE